MEFGYTIPLQKRLKMEALPPGPTVAPFFCWAVHVLTIQRRKAVLAMNCGSRYCILLYGVRTADWARLPRLVENEIRAAILREGLSEYEAVRYFALSGPLRCTAAQGPNLVTELNWAMQILLHQAPLLDERRFPQPQVTHILNDETYYAGTSSKSGTPKEFFLAGFRGL